MTANLTADHVALRNLYSRYAFALDYGAISEVLDCVADDGVFRLSDRGDFVGHHEIGRLMSASHEKRDRHFLSNVLVGRVDQDTAAMRAYFLLIRQSDGTVMSYGYYDDEAVRCRDGQWRFSLKRINFDWRSEEYAARAVAQRADPGPA